jgi:undecaprenyl-phosphate galactose phosphotransferase
MTSEQRAQLARSVDTGLSVARVLRAGVRHHVGTELHVVRDRALTRRPAIPAAVSYRRTGLVGLRAACGAAFKRAVDLVGALILIAVLSPFIVAVSLAIWIEGGSVIYRHSRIGRNGQPFECLKFRTMVPNAEQVLKELLSHRPELREEWLLNHKLRDDPRITVVGRFLRRTSLDELPQLWNVIRGEMSLVGPRPVVRDELLRYGRSAPIYLGVQPGLTGLWQVSGRNDVSYRRRVAMDVYYVRNRNLWLDLYILALTTGVVFSRDGGAY